MIDLQKALVMCLSALQSHANDACRSAKTHGQAELGAEAVNWGDLGCVHAEYCLGSNGKEVFRVFIEEADPACPKLKSYIENYLCDSLSVPFPVEVTTEW